MSQQGKACRVLDAEGRTRWFLNHVLPHEAALRVWLSRRGAAWIGVDDVVQETYAVFASMENFDAIRNPRAYLFQVANSQVIRAIRKARVVSIMAMEDLGEHELPAVDATPECRAIEHDDLRFLAESIAIMPEKTREAFVLRRVRGLSQREIAERMGISESTVEKHIARGIRLLAARMGDGGNGAGMGSS